MKTKHLLFLLVCYGLTACEQIKKAYYETFAENIEHTEEPPRAQDRRTAETKERSVDLFDEPELLDKLQHELIGLPEFMGHEVKFTSAIYFTPNRVYLQVLDPENEDYIDWYDYRVADKAWKKGDPVKTTTRFSPEESSSSVETIPFSVAHRAYQALRDTSRHLDDVTINNLIFYQRDHQFRGLLRSARADFHYEIDKHGKILIFERL